MANAVALRQALAAFLGDERFRKFVHQGVGRGRLRFGDGACPPHL